MALRKYHGRITCSYKIQIILSKNKNMKHDFIKKYKTELKQISIILLRWNQILVFLNSYFSKKIIGHSNFFW